MTPRISRRWSRWAVPGVAFTAIVLAAPPDREVAGPVRPAMQQTSARASSQAAEQRALAETAHLELERLERLQSQPAVSEKRGTKIGNVFKATSWYVPPPPPPPKPPAPPPPPSAPPLPFTYLGWYEDAPTRLIILVKGDRMYTVAEGDVIEETYRVERVIAGRVELTYLPLNITQSLATGEVL